MSHITLYKLLTSHGTWVEPPKPQTYTEMLCQGIFKNPKLVAKKGTYDLIRVKIGTETLIFSGSWGDGTVPELNTYKVCVEVSGAKTYVITATSPDDAFMAAVKKARAEGITLNYLLNTIEKI